MTFWRTNRWSPIGLDLAGRWIKAVQLSGAPGAWHVESAVVLPHPESPWDPGRAEWLRDVLARRGFRGERVVLAAPVQKLEAEILELPPRTSGAPIEEIARAELASRARLATGTFEMECWDVPAPPRGHAGTSMVAVALRHEDAAALLDPLEAAGLEVVGIDTRACALARAIEPPGAGEEPFVVVDLEWDIGFVAFVHAGQVLFQRSTADVSLGGLHRAVATEFDLDDALTEHLLCELPDPSVSGAAPLPQARMTGLLSQYAAGISDELEASLAFAAHRYPGLPVRNLLLCGDGARVKGLREQLALRLGRDVQPAAPRVAAEQVNTREIILGLAAIGLAMWQEGGRR